MKIINLPKMLVTLCATTLFTSHAVAAEPNDSLVKYGEAIAASSEKGSIKVRTAFKTTESPMRAYRVDFSSSLKSMMARQDADKNKEAYLLNVGKRELWQQKFCTDDLKNIMRKYQIDLVSGMLQNKLGEMQFLASCFKG